MLSTNKLRRHLIESRSMKLCSFVSRLQKLNAYLAEFPSDTEGRESAPHPTDEIIDIIYNSMPIMCKNKMIDQDFNYAKSTANEMTDSFETRVETWSPRKKRKIFFGF